MQKHSNPRRERRQAKQQSAINQPTYYEPKNEIKPLKPLNAKQKDYINSIHHNTVTFGLGSAGSGKTFIAGAVAADMLKEGVIDRLIVSRPGVVAGRDWGALPGELSEKVAPFMEPIIDVLNHRLGVSQTEYYIKRGVIQVKPLEFMRGTNFENAMVILDEAQNTTVEQMYLILTRIGRNCKMVIDGDLKQKDIRNLSGLLDAIQTIEGVNGVGIIEFGMEDCVRSGIVRDILFAYDRKDR